MSRLSGGNQLKVLFARIIRNGCRKRNFLALFRLTPSLKFPCLSENHCHRFERLVRFRSVNRFPIAWSRREFVKLSFAASLGVMGISRFRFQTQLMPYRIAFLGTDDYGCKVLGSILRIPNVQIAALCDADKRRLGMVAASVEQATRHRPRLYADDSDLFQCENVNLAIVAAADRPPATNTLSTLCNGSHVLLLHPVCRPFDRLFTSQSMRLHKGRFLPANPTQRILPELISLPDLIQDARCAAYGLPVSSQDFRTRRLFSEWGVWLAPLSAD